jgi:pyruvate dehydrogenase (quinone)
MAMQVSDVVVERLLQWGVERVFGYPGDGINGLLGAMGRAQDRMTWTQVRHEELAAFMAAAHAKFTGEVGVCVATSGPGAIHLLNGLYDAKMDHVPVVAIVGQVARISMGADYQQEVDLISLFKDVAHNYVVQVQAPAGVRQAIDRAMRIALATRSPTCVILPKDVQEMEAEAPPHEHGAVFTGSGYVAPKVVPVRAHLERAAEVLGAGKRVAILVGAGCLGAGDVLLQVADRLGAGVAKALLGKAVCADDAPGVTGSIGLLGTKPSWDMMMECDTLLMVGTTFPYSEFLPKEGQARAVQIDIDGKHLSMRYPCEVNLIGDARTTLEALLPLLPQQADRSWRKKIDDGMRDWWETMRARAMVPANPINPQRVFWELSPKLPDRCILTEDSGSSANWFARDLKIRDGMMASLSGNLATMGPGMPYAAAAKLAHPDRVVFAFVGDGAMQMNGMNELISVAQYWKKWSDPRLIVCVLNNQDLNQVTWEMRAMTGDPKFVPSQRVPASSYARYADQLGLIGITLDDPEQIASTWDRALAADRPVVIDAIVDPEVPPLPPHITLEQAKAFTKSVLKGDPESGRFIKQAFLHTVAPYFPGKKA